MVRNKLFKINLDFNLILLYNIFVKNKVINYVKESKRINCRRTNGIR